MKLQIIAAAVAIGVALNAAGETPVYLDTTKPLEERVNAALGRMTTEEKVAIIHAQSKFSSAGVPRLGIPELWCTDGPHGIRPEVFWDEWDQAGWTNDSCTAFPALTCPMNIPEKRMVLYAAFPEVLASSFASSFKKE